MASSAGEKTRFVMSAAAMAWLVVTALPLRVSEPASGRLEMMTALREWLSSESEKPKSEAAKV